ncbi:MAG: hypothetical protein CL873_01325 [Dehalococcoidales bacterium]|nr:hypothetical protein [Dehalococcoidales bacterium]
MGTTRQAPKVNMSTLFRIVRRTYAELVFGDFRMPGQSTKILKNYAQRLPPGALVLDAGAGELSHQSLFRSQRYLSLEIDRDFQPLLQGDLCALPIRDQTLEAILCSQVLEHLPQPGQALKEMWRVLKLDGTVLISVPFFYPVHTTSARYGDYYRWTEFGLGEILNQNGFEMVSIYYKGGLFSAMVEAMVHSFMQWLKPPGRLWGTIYMIPFCLAQSLVRLVLLPLEAIMALLDLLHRTRDCPMGYTVIGRKVDKVSHNG